MTGILRARQGGIVVLVALSIIAIGGCKDGVFDWSFMMNKETETVVDDAAFYDPLFESGAYRDTVAEHAYLDGLRRLRVAGYGIVVGLGRSGSTECPRGIRSQLIQEMYKTRKFAERRGVYVSPEELIDAEDTAVVSVQGEIHAAAIKGQQFDLDVSSIPGTQTTSLEGGWLYPCNLSIYKSGGREGSIQGKTLAVGAGPIFINPFGRGDDSATRADLRQGIVIGGGKADDNRRIRLLLTVPSYQRATAIARCINQRFGTATTIVADAISPAEIRISIPPRYVHVPRHFLAVVQHAYLPVNRPGFISTRLQELEREFLSPDAPHAEIALAWEAIGRTAMDRVRAYYDDANDTRSFYAALAGLRLNDDHAVEVLDRHLKNDEGAYRQAAIKGLEQARQSLRAARPLRDALSADDPRIRVAAYEALLARNDPTIGVRNVGDAFAVDTVKSDAENLIYIKRSDAPRIALFGDSIQAHPPLFFGLPDNSLLIDADEGDRQMTLVRTSRLNGGVSPPIKGDFDVKEFITLMGNSPPQSDQDPVNGLGIDYSSIVLVLSKLCDVNGINAKLVIENPAFTSMLRSRDTSGRPDSEL